MSSSEFSMVMKEASKLMIASNFTFKEYNINVYYKEEDKLYLFLKWVRKFHLWSNLKLTRAASIMNISRCKWLGFLALLA